jgi:hypothetical protein
MEILSVSPINEQTSHQDEKHCLEEELYKKELLEQAISDSPFS